ncbi:MAG: DUF2281 domain-containing protein [Bacteroidetes bacterium]|nr:MAG: DUF2281 domain-containing protein [Bacteroidota bacterium]
MKIAISGTYQEGKIFISKKPDFKAKPKVVILFESENEDIKKRKFGILKGKISASDNFDDPLDDLKEYM